jgi:glutathione S-transferase
MNLYIGNKVYSSWSLRPWIVMKAKDIAFQETLVELRAHDTPERIKKFSPSGKVPCLVDGDVTVWESLAIMEYLAEKFPDKSIWPKDAKARAHARAISSEMHAGFQPLRQACPMAITQRFQSKPLPADVATNVARITAIWNEARAKFGAAAQGPFLYGDFSAADGMYAPVISRFYTYGIKVDAVCQVYMDAMRAHPAYQAWVAEAAAEPWVLAQNEGETIIEDLRAKPKT